MSSRAKWEKKNLLSLDEDFKRKSTKYAMNYENCCIQ